ncbi:MAG: sialate O-acetylesterase, partial [Trueperaceae bacterium]|nr:sialate O-acetylesterase [Trueperaceae bacterium]
ACTPPQRPPTIDAFEVASGRVLPGAVATVRFEARGAERLVLEGPDLVAVDVTGHTAYDVEDVLLGTYTLRASNDAGTGSATATLARLVRPLLVAGQSNAQGVNLPAVEAATFVTAIDGVQMLGNDDVWRAALEPLDDCTGQVDPISQDPGGGTQPCVAQGNSGVSMGVAFGNRLVAAVGDEVLLIPAARGGSVLDDDPSKEWWPDPDRAEDRTTLFGSAIRRWRLAAASGAAAAYGAVFWYQGESEAHDGAHVLYADRTDRVLDAFRTETGVPVLFVQLSRYVADDVEPDPGPRNLLYQQVREQQCALATGARSTDGNPTPYAGEDGRFLVVAHDLPMITRNHLDAASHVELARRVVLAFREHVLGEDVDGTGPRLQRIDHAVGTRDVMVRFDVPISPPAVTSDLAYGGYFAVLSGGVSVDVASIERDPDDDRSVWLRLVAPSSQPVEVRYMPPPENSEQIVLDVVRAAACEEAIPGTDACLPAPAFGAALEAGMLDVLETLPRMSD